MISTNTELREELDLTLNEIEAQISAVKGQAFYQDVDPQYLKDSDGDFAMTPLLLAKSNILNAIAMTMNRTPIYNINNSMAPMPVEQALDLLTSVDVEMCECGHARGEHSASAYKCRRRVGDIFPRRFCECVRFQGKDD